MHSYSYPRVHASPSQLDARNSLAPDSHTFDTLIHAESLSEYTRALHAAIDALDAQSSQTRKGASARTHVCALRECSASVESRDATVTRYLSRVVNARR